MSKIVIIKSVIGEEIIAELESNIHPEWEDAITLSRPRIFQFQNVNGDMQPALVPWIITYPECRSVPMNNAYIATMIEAPHDIAKAYQSATSGLVLQ